MEEYKWVVIVMSDHYPSVFLFETEEKAQEKYNSLPVEDGDIYDDQAVIMAPIANLKGLFWNDFVDWT